MVENFDRFIIGVPHDEISTLVDSIKFEINGFGYFLQQESADVPVFTIKDYEWILYTQGNAQIACEEHIYDIEAGDLVLLEPDKQYSAKCIGIKPLHYYYIHFQMIPDYLSKTYIESIFGRSTRRFLRSGTIPDFAPQFGMLLKDRLHGEVGTAVLIYSMLVRMSIYMMRGLWNLQATHSANDPMSIPRGEDMRICSQAIALMRAHLDKAIRIEDICSEMGVSTSYLYKLFMRVFHQSPSQFLMEEKMKFVCHLLLDEGTTLAEASIKLGFSSASHLSSQFKKVFGITPSQWLKSKKQSNPD